MLCLEIWFKTKHWAEWDGLHLFEFNGFLCEKDPWSSRAKPYASTHTEAALLAFAFDSLGARHVYCSRRWESWRIWSWYFQQLVGCFPSLPLIKRVLELTRKRYLNAKKQSCSNRAKCLNHNLGVIGFLSKLILKYRFILTHFAWSFCTLKRKRKKHQDKPNKQQSLHWSSF